MRNSIVIVETESDLINAFRFKDRKFLQIPETLRFPLTFDHYMTWSEPTGNFQFLVFRKYGEEELVGLVFDRSDAGQSGRTQMCSWCQTTGPSNEIDMLTCQVNSHVTCGVIACINLDCINKLDAIAKFSRKNIQRLTEDLVGRMSLFYERKLE